MSKHITSLSLKFKTGLKLNLNKLLIIIIIIIKRSGVFVISGLISVGRPDTIIIPLVLMDLMYFIFD